MAEKVHIVNGDSAFHLLRDAGVTEDIIVWREMLCDGPCLADPRTDEFWASRIPFFETSGVSKSQYLESSKAEIQKIESLSKEQEIHLWFEQDLFCFVNLQCLLHYLNLLELTERLIIHCPEGQTQESRFLNLSDFKPDEIETIEIRHVDQMELVYSSAWWQAYVDGDSKKLEEYSEALGGFAPLALIANFDRIPREGISLIEEEILSEVGENGLSVNDLLQYLLQWQGPYHFGFGDLQFAQRIKRLEGSRLKIEEEYAFPLDENAPLSTLRFGGFVSS